MFYSAVQTAKPSLIVRLSLATTKTPWIASSWQRVGPIFPVLTSLVASSPPPPAHSLAYGNTHTRF